jgi:hypothetical protein
MKYHGRRHNRAGEGATTDFVNACHHPFVGLF